MRKPIICLDFDGVCHSYTSGWQGAAVISDPPVEGLFEFLDAAAEHFEIHIFSSRSHQDGGIEAMRAWFRHHYRTRYPAAEFSMPELEFPLTKPPAKVTLDDRGLLFNGIWPSVETLVAFQPWNKR